jgi:hypothetical protein
LNHFDGR